MKAEQQQAYILHQRPYRETSLLLDVLTQKYGRLSLVAKGVKRTKRSQAGLMQLYQPLFISWSGRGDLLTLIATESAAVRHSLQGSASLCGLYLNELIIRLLALHDPAEMVYLAYRQALIQLADIGNNEIVLRLFEKRLLSQLGYRLNLEYEVESGQAIEDELRYYYIPESGLYRWHSAVNSTSILGRSLRQLIEEDGFDHDGLLEIKQLMRHVLQYYLGEKPLKTRQLFAELQQYTVTR